MQTFLSVGKKQNCCRPWSGNFPNRRETHKTIAIKMDYESHLPTHRDLHDAGKSTRHAACEGIYEAVTSPPLHPPRFRHLPRQQTRKPTRILARYSKKNYEKGVFASCGDLILQQLRSSSDKSRNHYWRVKAACGLPEGPGGTQSLRNG